MASIVCLALLVCLGAAALVDAYYPYYGGYRQPYYVRPPPRRPQYGLPERHHFYGTVFGYMERLPTYFYNNYVCNTMGVNYYYPTYGSSLSQGYYHLFRGKRQLNLHTLAQQWAAVRSAYALLEPFWDKSEKGQLLKDVLRVTRNIAKDEKQELKAVNVVKQVVQEKIVATADPANVEDLYNTMQEIKNVGQKRMRFGLLGVIRGSCSSVRGPFYCSYLEKLTRLPSCTTSYLSRYLHQQCCGPTAVNPPVDPPVTSPVNPPVDPPVDPPVTPPVDPPVDTTVDPPVDTTVDPPVDTTVKPPVDTTVDPPVTKNCGISIQNPAADSADFQAMLTRLRIVGGVNADRCEYPWMVRLQAGGDLCGGTIIDETHILTAGHCISSTDPADYKVHVGEYNFNIQEPQDLEVGVSKITRHPNYVETNGAVENDAAILTLDQPLTFDDCVQPICIPEAGSSTRLDDAKCIATGWGTTSFQGSASPILQEVALQTVNGDLCNSNFPNTTPTNADLQICAGKTDGGADSCQGDSGGPLFCPVDGKYVQYGIVSYGDGCGKPGSAGVYTDVSAVTDFINSVISTN